MSSQNELPAISRGALAAFRSASPHLIKETVAQSLLNTADVVQHADQAENLITAGLEFTTRMLDSAMSVGVPALLEDELLWAKDRLPHDGVSMHQVNSRLKIYRGIILNKLSPRDAAEVVVYLDWMIAKLGTLVLPD
jgi:hypothetical protein